MDNIIPVFKQWVPEWLVKIILLLVILPSMALFFLPLANINAAAGHYGGEPADIQFAVALFYTGFAGFYCLERRFFSYLATKEYFIIFTILQILSSYACYQTKSLAVLFPLRFIQGMGFASMVNLSLSLLFNRLKTERAREIGFSIFYGLLLCAVPFNNLLTADIIDSFNFSIVYKCTVLSYLPGLAMVLITMNNIRPAVRFPLYQLDWQSFTLYSVILGLLAYMLIYGQEYYWLEDTRMLYSTVAIILLGAVYLLRQAKMKRPYTNLSVFRFRNFKVGILLLLIMYICRFASGITNTFFVTVLRFDPKHVSYINLLNITGIAAGVIISCCMILQKKNIRYIWIPGFVLLLVFHGMMFFLFDTQANEDHFFIPLLLQGLGVGMIMTPTIVYAISSVPVAMGPSAASFCLTTRFLGFCISIALINYFELFEKSRHYNAFQDQLTRLNPIVKNTLAKETRRLLGEGMAPGGAAKMSNKLLVNAVNGQSQLRFAMDYYEIMCWLLSATLLLIALLPYLNRTAVYLRSRRLSPA